MGISIMQVGSRRINLLQAAICGIALLAGGILYWTGSDSAAGWAWKIGAVLVLVSALVDTALALWRKEVGLDVIAIAAIGGALALDETFTAAVIALMFAGGRALEDYAENRARREMAALLERAPRMANRYEGTAVNQVPLDAVRPGDRLLVRAGDTLPVDGTLQSTYATIDESSLTGEPLPVTRAAGSVMQSGTVNAGEAFDMVATRAAQDSTFSGIVRLVESAQRSKAPAARMADRYALAFVPLAFGIAGLAWLVTGDPERALAVAVVATPCPLILAVPVAIVCAMSRCAQLSVLVKHGGALEKMAEVTSLFVDKTGTLTAGNAGLVSIETDGTHDADHLLRLAASVEQLSGHVIAQAVVHAARERGLNLQKPAQVTETAGAGLSGTVDGNAVRVGSLAFAAGDGDVPPWAANTARRIAGDGATGVYIAIDGVLRAVIKMADEVRLDTPRAIRLLRAAGVRNVAMLTGDRRDVATAIGNMLGVDQVLPEQTPATKLAAIAAARQSGITMMVGDGINDAAALAAADVGVAMGARGAAAAAESAQVVLLVDRLDRLASAVRIAKETKIIALQCVIAGMTLSLAAMIVAAFGYIPPIAGAILQELIDIAVIANALRVLRLGRVKSGAHLSAEQVARLKDEHARLIPLIDRLRSLANSADTLPPTAIHKELELINASLKGQLLPHESQDDAVVYPRLARMIGGDDPMTALSSTHREIHRLSRTIDRMAGDTTPGPADLSDLRKTLYALDAILRLHFEQEEEIYHNLSS